MDYNEIPKDKETITPSTITEPYLSSNLSNQRSLKPPSENHNFKSKLKIVAALFLFMGLCAGMIKVASLVQTNIKPQPVTITYWGLWEDDKVIQPLINEYKNTHPNITITYQQQSPNLYEERLQQGIKTGNGPDIFRFHNTWLPMLRNDLSPVPESVFTAQEYEKTFYPVTKSDLKIGQNYYGIPFEIDTLLLFYNVNIFKEANIDPSSIVTWPDLRTTAQKLTVKVNGKITRAGVAIGTTNNIDYWSDILGLMFLQNGTDMTKVDSTILADGSNAGEDILNYYTSGFAKGESSVWDETLDNSTLAFAAERLAMYFGPSIAAFDIKRLNPVVDFKILPVPQNPNQQTNWATYWVEGVGKKSKVQKEAWDFLKFLSESKSLQKMYDIESQERLFGEPFSRVDIANKLKDNKWISPVINQAFTARSWYFADKTQEGEKGINRQMQKILSDTIYQISTGKTIKDALKETNGKINTVLASYGLIEVIPTSSSR